MAELSADRPAKNQTCSESVLVNIWWKKRKDVSSEQAFRRDTVFLNTLNAAHLSPLWRNSCSVKSVYLYRNLRGYIYIFCWFGLNVCQRSQIKNSEQQVSCNEDQKLSLDLHSVWWLSEHTTTVTLTSAGWLNKNFKLHQLSKHVEIIPDFLRNINTNLKI